MVTQEFRNTSPQLHSWRVRCFDSKGRCHSDRTLYEPMSADERTNLEHHFTLQIDTYSLTISAEQSAATANFIAIQSDAAGEA